MTITNKRFTIDLLLIAALAIVPRFLGIGFEVNRYAVLAGVYAAVAILGVTGILRDRARRTVDVAFGLFTLALAWCQSFPAWNHSSEIGLYIVFGAVLLAMGTSAPRRVAAAS